MFKLGQRLRGAKIRQEKELRPRWRHPLPHHVTSLEETFGYSDPPGSNSFPTSFLTRFYKGVWGCFGLINKVFLVVGFEFISYSF